MQFCVILPDIPLFIKPALNVIRNNYPGGDLPDDW